MFTPFVTMPLIRSPRRVSRHALRLALVAMLLLVIGPLIGQLSAFGAAGHGHHAMASASAPAMAPDATHSGSPHHAAASGWHDQCGYCTLFQHCPVLDAAMPHAARAPYLSSAMPPGATRPAHGDLAVFPHALTRAPPGVFG